MDNNKEITPDIFVLKFADSKVPVFKETRNKEYIKYGEDDQYPAYLTYLFNKSSKHNAIITGKADYIFGGGFENGNNKVNRIDESLNDITRKCILDVEIYGGFYLEVVWGFNGKISEVYHVDYTTIRKAKSGGYYYKEVWDKYTTISEAKYINEFNPLKPEGSQIYAYGQYRPGVRYYPLPGYIGSNNYIETDIEISKYYLSCIRNGMMPSKMIQFYTGEPTEDKKKEIERRLQKKFSGAENAGNFFLVFNGKDGKSVEIEDLSASDLDKHMEGLNKLCQEEIFSGHKITSPMLFGIKTEGQLGGVNEIKTAYRTFVNTYAKPRAKSISKEIEFLFSYSQWPYKYELTEVEPVDIQFDIKDVINALPVEFILEKIGVPKELWGKPTINGSVPVVSSPVAQENKTEVPVNNIVTNLNAKQQAQISRIIRQYNRGLITPGAPHTLTEAAAKALLKPYGFDDQDMNDLLGIEPVISADIQMQSDSDDDAILAMFDACGEDKNDYDILNSKRVTFSSDEEAEQYEHEFIRDAFQTYDVTISEAAILDLIKRDPLITIDVIASAIGQTRSYVQSKIDSLAKRGYLEIGSIASGTDTVIKRTVPKDIDITKPPKADIPTSTIKVMYSYEGPEDSRNRPFCAKMMKLNRLYTRKEIENISQRLGYSVWDRRGGFWNRGNGVISASCRHRWESQLVVKKKA